MAGTSGRVQTNLKSLQGQTLSASGNIQKKEISGFPVPEPGLVGGEEPLVVKPSVLGVGGAKT